jgi:hypothetical protein
LLLPEEAASEGAANAPVAVSAAARPRRRGRTALLIAGAVVLGLVAGTCVGYLVQADREPTPLASLSQPTLRQEKGEGPEPLSAARDRRVKTDGDLRKLLLKKPSGARDAEWRADSDGWMSLAEYADTYTRPKQTFGDLLGEEFRRAVVTGWETGGPSTVEIRLIQFLQEEDVAADTAAHNAQLWAEKENSTDSYVIPGTADGMAYVHREPETKPGYLPQYSAQAHAWRGDIAMEIWVSSGEPISKKTILDLATRQMERL